MWCDMISIDVFRALDLVPHTLIIVTAGDPENPRKRGGMTVAWGSRVSWNPPLFAISIGPSKYTYQLIEEYGAFAVHTVSKKLVDAAVNIFGSLSGRDVDKFKLLGIEPVKARRVTAPIIPIAPVIMECKVVSKHIAGDHVLFIAEVVEAYQGSEETPLAFLDGNAIEIVSSGKQ